MADAVAMRAAFTRLGFSNQAALTIVNDQGINSVEELSILTDHEVETLCKVVRRPGGQIANPNAGEAGQPDNIPNPGINVPLRAENNMKLAAYYCRFREKTSRATTPANIELDPVRTVRPLRDWENAHEEQEPEEGLINAKDWHKMLEALEEYLRRCLGVTKIPLAYVVRENEAVTADPDPDAANRGWSSMQDEMIGRAPIMQAGQPVGNYLTDRATVWDKIASLTRDQPCWTYVKAAQRTRDGRMAFKALMNHYLGDNMVGILASSVERKLTSTKYYGKKRRWNFEKYASVHVEQHGILEGLASRVPPAHVGIDERAKVRYLLDGIESKDLESCTTQILSNQALLHDFNACVNLYKDYLATTKPSMHATAQVSTLKVNEGRNPQGGAKTYTIHEKDIQDRYYKNSEYAKISPQGRKKLKRLRDARGHVPNKKQTTAPDKSVMALATKLATLATNQPGEQGQEVRFDESVAPDQQGVQSNRTHPSLTRQSE